MRLPVVGLTRSNWLREFSAGITLLAISVPLNIGYAQIAGLPATAGLYALIVPTVGFALLVSSRQVVASPDAAAAAMVASSLMGMGAAGSGNYAQMAAAQAILGGVMFLLCAVFKLGFLADFLSKPILVGFVGGLALDITVSQAAKVLGVPINSGGEFGEKLFDLVSHLGEANLWAMCLGISSILILLWGRRIIASAPWALMVMIAATAASVLFDLQGKGVSVLGKVPAGLPTFSVPVLSWSTWLALIPSAIALTAVAVAEGLLVSRQYGEKNNYSTDPNRDLLAFGAANIASGFSSSFTLGSSTSRTAAMDVAGSRTQLPSLVLAVGTLLLLLFGTDLLADIPSPAIGAIVAVAVFKLIGFLDFRELWTQSRAECAIGAACFVGVLVVGPIGGITLAFVLSLVNLARRASNPAVDILAGSDDPTVSLLDEGDDVRETAPGVIIMRFAAPIFFANGSVLADRARNAVESAPHPVTTFVLDLEAVTDIDVTGAGALIALREWLHSRSVTLGFSRVRPPLQERFTRFGLLESARLYRTNRDVVSAFRMEFTTPDADVPER